MANLKPQIPLMSEGDYIYPLTTIDQILMEDGTKANQALATKDYVDNIIPFSLGIDENGNYGYIKAGADTVTPFKNLSSLKRVYTYTQASAKNGANSITVSGLNVTEAIIVVWFQYTGTGSGANGVYCGIDGISGASYTKLLGQTATDQGYTFCFGLLKNITNSVTITTVHNQSNIHANVRVDIFAL